VSWVGGRRRGGGAGQPEWLCHGLLGLYRVFRGGSRRGQSTACACTPRRGFGGTGRWTGGRRPFLKAKHDEDDPEDEEEDEEDNSEHEEDEAQLEEDEAIFDQETITDAENIRCGPWPLCVFRRP